MTSFRSMGCTVELPDVAPDADVRALFEERDGRFSRFRPDSELSRLNRVPAGASLVSEEFSHMLGHALRAAMVTSGLVTPAVGAAVVAAGYDADFDRLPADGPSVQAVPVPPLQALSLRGTLLVRAVPIELDLNCVVKGATVDDALALLGGGFVAAGGDVATSAPLVVGLPGGGAVTLHGGGLATSSVTRRRWRRGGEDPASPDRPGDGRARPRAVAACDGRRRELPGRGRRCQGRAAARGRWAVVARPAWAARPLRRRAG